MFFKIFVPQEATAACKQSLAFRWWRDFPKHQLSFHPLGMEHFLLLMQQSGGLHGHELPTKAACDQEKSFHFQCTWIISTIWRFWMPQWLGVAPWLFLFSSFSIDYSSAFQSKQKLSCSQTCSARPFSNQTHSIPQGPSPLGKGIKTHHTTWIFIPTALQHEEFPSLFLLLE